ncbi:MAG: hypothetical protein RID07_08970 [Lacipirellulaceae bacterium]
MALEALRNRYPNAVTISAKSGEGLDGFAQAVSAALSSDFLDLEVEVPISDGRTTAFLAKFGDVKSQTFTEETTTVHCRLAKKYLGPLRDTPEIVIRERQAAAQTAANPQAERDPVGEVA